MPLPAWMACESKPAGALRRRSLHGARTRAPLTETQAPRECGELARSVRSGRLQLVRERVRANLELDRFADFFFDGLIVDWIVQSKIVQSLEQSETAKDRIIVAVKELENLREITQNKIGDTEEKRAQLIERA